MLQSPTSIVGSPTSTGVSPTKPGAVAKPVQSAAASPADQAKQLKALNAQAVQDALAQNAEEQFVIINTPNGPVYAEFGRPVSQAQFNADRVQSAASKLEAQVTPVSGKAPGSYLLRVNGQTVYFGSRDEASQFVQDLAAGTARLYQTGGLSFASAAAAQAYAQGQGASFYSEMASFAEGVRASDIAGYKVTPTSLSGVQGTVYSVVFKGTTYYFPTPELASEFVANALGYGGARPAGGFTLYSVGTGQAFYDKGTATAYAQEKEYEQLVNQIQGPSYRPYAESYDLQVGRTPRGISGPGSLDYSLNVGGETVYFSSKGAATGFAKQLAFGTGTEQVFNVGGILFGDIGAAQRQEAVVQRQQAQLQGAATAKQLISQVQPANAVQGAADAGSAGKYVLVLPNGSEVYFASMADARSFITTLVANGTAPTYSVGGLSFGSKVSAQAYYSATYGSQATVTGGRYTFQGKSFSSIPDIEAYLQSEYPGATITPVYGKATPAQLRSAVGNEFDSLVTGFSITQPSPVQAQAVSHPYGDPFGILSGAFSAEFNFFAGLGQQVRGGLVKAGYTPPAYFDVSQTQAVSQAVGSFAAYAFPGGPIAHLVSYPSEPLSQKGLDVVFGAVSVFGPAVALRVGSAVLPIARPLIPVLFGELQAGAGVVMGGKSVLGFGAEARSPIGILENFLFGTALASGAGIVRYARASYDVFATPTREFAGTTETPLLSRYTAPTELGEPEFAGSPGRLLAVKGQGYSSIFVEETGDVTTSGAVVKGVSVRTESDILESSLLSQQDLARLTNLGESDFVSFLESRAPVRVAGAEGNVRFSEAFNEAVRKGEGETFASPERAQEVEDMLATTEQRQASGQATVLLAPQEQAAVESPLSDQTSLLDQAITESRVQAQVRIAAARAAARGQGEDVYTLLAVPPGVALPARVTATKSTFTELLATRASPSAGARASTEMDTLTSMTPGTDLLSSSLSLGRTATSLAEVQGASSITIPAQREQPLQVQLEDLSLYQGSILETELGLREAALTAQLTEQATLQTEEPTQRSVLLPSVASVERRRGRTRRRARFADYSIRNIVSENIAESFGAFGLTLAEEDVFGRRTSMHTKGGKARRQRSDFEELIGLA